MDRETSVELSAVSTNMTLSKEEWNEYIRQYWLLHSRASVVADRFTTHFNQEAIPLFFWPSERDGSIALTSRIKGVQSLYDKIVSKCSNPLEIKAFLREKSDFIGLRIVVGTKDQLKRAVQMITDENNTWEVQNAEAFSNSRDNKFYQSLGLKIVPRSSGYCGIHFDVHTGDRDVPWAEIQVRTKIQDAWEFIDHSIYKVESRLSKEQRKDFSSLQEARRNLAQQFEASESLQQSLVQLTEEKLQSINGQGLFHHTKWIKKFDVPRNIIGKLIKSKWLDCYYEVDKDMIRYTLVVEDTIDRPPQLITEKYLESNYPALSERVLVVDDVDMAMIPLAGNVEVRNVQ